VQISISFIYHFYANVVNAVVQVGGYFRGLSFPLVSVAAINAVFFGVYGNVLSRLQLVTDGDRCRSVSKYAGVYVAGCAAGVAQTVVACPSDLVKVVLQSQLNHNGKHTSMISPTESD